MSIVGSVQVSPAAARAGTFVSATAFGAAIVLLRLPLEGYFKGEAPFLLAWPGVIAAAFFGGFWPAVLVSVLGFFVGQNAMLLAGEPAMGPGAIGIYTAFVLVFAGAGGARKQALRKAKTDAARLEEMRGRLLNVARLNAAGEMAGTLAHELNQPLTSVATYMTAARRLLERDGALKPQVAEVLDKAAAQALRAGDIVARVRGFLRRGEIQQAPEDLPQLIRETANLALATPSGRRVKLRYDIAPGVAVVSADRVQVQQVVLNLLRNAVEAVAVTGRPELVIGVRPADDPGLVQAWVADKGPGVDPELTDRLFQPFVTSKTEGMGIGLSVSRSIIEAHGGRLWHEPGADGGAVFCFTLRRAEPAA